MGQDFLDTLYIINYGCKLKKIGEKMTKKNVKKALAMTDFKVKRRNFQTNIKNTIYSMSRK